MSAMYRATSAGVIAASRVRPKPLTQVLDVRGVGLATGGTQTGDVSLEPHVGGSVERHADCSLGLAV
jgi:hypothetical protein